ncbi:OPT oligopeptide transporter [Penicillium angulare]|uniref:OPT oligopeptide transporter n=1 Tax=Penicillium angulare TaxID=116970 RepID=A0A9W9K0B2_9EURO|nr:OPT oligopeptide transporter [Penicillium angulare]
MVDQSPGAGLEEEAQLGSTDSQTILEHDNLPTFTYRSLGVGLIIGIVACLSNVYFGLQNGFADTMSMATSLLGFGFFRPWGSSLNPPFGPKENVLIQSIAGAMASMPITAGLISVVVALETLLGPSEGGPLHFKWIDLTIWALGLSFSGAFVAMLLRDYILRQDSMPFPSATASATIIKSFHNQNGKPVSNYVSSGDEQAYISIRQGEYEEQNGTVDEPHISENSFRDMGLAFLVSGIITIVEIFVTVLHDIPFLGNHMAENWLWTFNLSPGIFGQGIITGPSITLHMLAGTIVGWGILSPIAKSYGWAPGDVNDWTSGSRGWTLWIAISILLSDCLVNLIWMLLTLERVQNKIRDASAWTSQTFARCFRPTTTGPIFLDDQNNAYTNHIDPVLETEHHDTGKSKLLTSAKQYHVLGTSIFASALLCTATTKFTFGEDVPVGATFLAIGISAFLGLISIRAMGQTDHSPVSALGKLSQFLFAAIISKSNPHRFIINLAMGAIGEAGAAQATGLMYDLKTGAILGANPWAQLSGHLLGSLLGAFVSTAFYKLYTTVYTIPGPLFQTPTAYIWVAAAKMAYGAGLPPYSFQFSIGFAIVFAVIAALKIRFEGSTWSRFIPGGVAFAVGMVLSVILGC